MCLVAINQILIHVDTSLNYQKTLLNYASYKSISLLPLCMIKLTAQSCDLSRTHV